MESIRLKYIEATTTDPDVEYLIKLISYTTYVHREQPCLHLLLLIFLMPSCHGEQNKYHRQLDFSLSR